MLSSVVVMSIAIFTIFRIIKNMRINTIITNPLINIPALVIIIFIASMIITIIFKKIKIINKIV